MWTMIISMALGGTITVTSELPIGVKIDGNLASSGTTELEVRDLDPGRHLVEATSLAGNAIDSYEVELSGPDDVVELLFVNRRLRRAVEGGDPETLMGTGPKAIGEADFAKLQAQLVKGSAKKKYKKLGPYIADHWFTVRQIKTIVAAWEKMGDRAYAARMLATKCIDPENAGAMDGLFPSLAIRAEVHEAYGIP
jgi:hypothetical protein